jgi:hypothetical protein
MSSNLQRAPSASSTVQRAPADFWDKWDSTRVSEVPPRPVEPANEAPPDGEPSLGRRASRAILRFLVTLGVGVGGTLAWQAFGDDARQMMAMAYPQQLAWVAPQATTNALAPQGAAAPASAAPAPAVDQQQLNALSLNLAAVRQSVDQLAAQVASGQQQMSGDIARLQASEQDILAKIAASPPRPAPIAARKPAPPTVVAPSPPAPAAQGR